jgi:mannose-6-phosphate isomerase
VKIRRLSGTVLDKVWGSTDTEPWYPHSERKTGEIWFTAAEEARLLIKFLFTSESLSVQVHPGDSASGAGKTEMWHVLRADAGARLALGFSQPLTAERVRAAALSGEIEELLRWYPVQPGDTFFVPAGTVHAIGAGLALCEIQQYSDVTYRLYDYGRPRELHLDAALAVANLDGHPGPSTPGELGAGRRLLVECRYFRTESVAVDGESTYAGGPHAEFLICVDGGGEFDGQPFGPGQVWIVPAGTDAFAISTPQGARLLCTCVP